MYKLNLSSLAQNPTFMFPPVPMSTQFCLDGSETCLGDGNTMNFTLQMKGMYKRGC